MACGTPVITSDTSSLPEVVGEAGIMVEPRNVRALAEAMEEVLADEGKRREMREKGLQQAAKFSWEHTAQETRGGYESTALALIKYAPGQLALDTNGKLKYQDILLIASHYPQYLPSRLTWLAYEVATWLALARPAAGGLPGLAILDPPVEDCATTAV